MGANAPVQTVHADFPHTACQWPVGSQHCAVHPCEWRCTRQHTPTPARGRHPPQVHARCVGTAPAQYPLGYGPELPLQLSPFGVGRLSHGALRHGLSGQSLRLTRSFSMTTAGTLRSNRVMPRGLLRCSLCRPVQYYDPLGLPLRTPRLRLGLVRARLPRLGLRRPASHVPHLSLHACCAPYPAAATSALRFWRQRCCLRRDMSGSACGL